MLFNQISANLPTILGFTGTKVPYWAGFCRFQKNFLLSFCFLRRNAAIVMTYQVITGLVRNKIRIAICQKQLLLSHFFWSLDCLHVQILHLLQARHQSQSQSRLWHQYRHKSTKDYSQEPIAVLGIPQMHACGGVS